MHRLISVIAGIAAWQVGALAAAAQERTWQRVDAGTTESAFTAVTADPAQPARVLASTRQAVVESSDEGQTWQERFRAPAQAAITDIAISPDGQPAILVATDQGLYGSRDGGTRWSRLVRGVGEEERHGTCVAFHPVQPDLAVLGTKGGLFVSRDRGNRWKRVPLPFAASAVVDFAWDPEDPERVYLVTTRGVFVGTLSQGAWQRRLPAFNAEEVEVEEPEVDASQPTEEPGSLHRLSAIAIDPQPPPTLYLAGSRGLQRSVDAGATWQPVARAGLPASGLSRLLLTRHSPLVLYAAAEEGVAAYEPAKDRWIALAQGLLEARVNDLASSPRHLWAATDQGLYRFPLPPAGFAESEPPPPPLELLSNFTYEPTIAQAREAAIRYAEVQPQKIASWRTQARLRALLPTFSMDTGTNLTDFRHWDSGANPDTLLRGERDLDWGTSVSWDLGDLIWSTDQTSIDVRSKLMVQLRDDIVDEVTRTYFERRRLQVALLMSPPGDQQHVVEQELKLQELTALLDGLTGGLFSRQIEAQHPTHKEEPDGTVGP